MEKEITDYLYSLRNRGAKLGLERVEALVQALGNPQESYRSILVGGTSGKGSTVAIISSILKEAGFKVGAFTSPHLSSLTERITINGEDIPQKELIKIINKIKDAIDQIKDKEGFEHPTFFEVMAAAAFVYFREQKVDFAVLEVGLGGRLDATRLASPEVSVITNISLEHTRILGDTVAKIAKEKAGIIRRNGILVTAAREDAFHTLEDACRERDARIMRIGDDVRPEREYSGIDGQAFKVTLPGRAYEGLEMPLLGRHQLENAACALGAIHALGADVPEKAVRDGLRSVVWPGRMEVMQKNPLVLLDCAKDTEAMQRLRQAIEDMAYDRLFLVLSISSDKDLRGMVDAIAPIADRVFIAAHKVMGRAAGPEKIAKEVNRHQKDHETITDVREATQKAISLAKEKDMVLVTGSLFTAAEAREIWHPARKAFGRELNEVPKR
jgi:dihydrofolate synthase/folylpolyglutamate synthase